MTAVDYKIEETKEPGHKTIAVTGEDGRKKYLHSTIAPSKETLLLADILDKADGKTVIVLGCGLGYHLKPLEKHKAGAKVIIIDILDSLESAVRGSIDLPQSAIFITGNDLRKIENSLIENVHIDEKTGFVICEHPSSVRVFPAFYEECRKIIDRVIRERVGNLVTKKKFGSIYIRNIAKTISSISSAFPFSSLNALFTGTPAVVVSSSPSVDGFISEIREMAQSAVIFCVDSAYPVLSAHGIRPDFVVTIDPQPWISEHLLNLDPSIPVLQAFSAWPLPKTGNPRFLSLTSHPLCQVFDHFFPDLIGSFDSKTGTVAGDAILAAVKTGCSPVYVAGIDLSFPDMNIYSKDSRYNTRFSGFLNHRTKPVESLHMAYIRNSSRNTTFEGKRTRHSFLQYRDKIISLAETLPASLVHLKGKGLSIDNIPAMSGITGFQAAAKNIQLINNLSTLSTIGSLIDTSALARLFSSDIVSDTVIEASGSDAGKMTRSFINISFPEGV